MPHMILQVAYAYDIFKWQTHLKTSLAYYNGALGILKMGTAKYTTKYTIKYTAKYKAI